MSPEQGGWKIEYQTWTCSRPPNHLGTFEEHQGQKNKKKKQKNQKSKLYTLLPGFLDLCVFSEYGFSSYFKQMQCLRVAIYKAVNILIKE